MAKRELIQKVPYIREVILRREDVPSFDQYPFCLNAIKDLTRIPFERPVTFFIGENGSGKSTLLEAIAVASGLNPEGGSKNFSFSTYTSHSCLDQYLTLAKGVHLPRDRFFLRAESYYNVASEIERLDNGPGGPPIKSYFGGKSLHEQSHGESFFAAFIHRLFGNGLYLLDEPEAALSPSRQLALIARMHQLVGMDSQFIVATHSPIILAYPEATIFQLDADGIRQVAYRETDHYRLTKDFLECPDRFLRNLIV